MHPPPTQPLLPWPAFVRRVAGHAAALLAVVGGSLGMGVLGDRVTEGMPWLDALLNASMILGGMGPVDPLRTTAGKLFASFYALSSGMIFLVAAGILLAPIAHRVFHRLHLEAATAVADGGPG